MVYNCLASVPAEMFWSIWLERNGRVFEEKRRKSPNDFRSDVKSLVVFSASVKHKDFKVDSSISWSSWEAFFLNEQRGTVQSSFGVSFYTPSLEDEDNCLKLPIFTRLDFRWTLIT